MPLLSVLTHPCGREPPGLLLADAGSLRHWLHKARSKLVWLQTGAPGRAPSEEAAAPLSSPALTQAPRLKETHAAASCGGLSSFAPLLQNHMWLLRKGRWLSRPSGRYSLLSARKPDFVEALTSDAPARPASEEVARAVVTRSGPIQKSTVFSSLSPSLTALRGTSPALGQSHSDLSRGRAARGRSQRSHSELSHPDTRRCRSGERFVRLFCEEALQSDPGGV